MMNPEVKALWLEALRSGEYQQGRGALMRCDPDGSNKQYCCLGVLTDLAVKAGKIAEGRLLLHYSLSGAVMASVYEFGGGSTAYPPHKVLEWGSLPSSLLMTSDYFNMYDLAAMNDDGRSFHDIANVIEERL